MRIRKSSTTEKWPNQSVRLSRTATTFCATLFGEGVVILNRITPLDTGNLRRNANSPNSLSKVTSTRFSVSAHCKTARSLLPGASVLIQTTSWPRARKGCYRHFRKVLVGQNTHGLDRHRIDTLITQYFTGITQAS